MLSFPLLDNCFSDSFNEVEIWYQKASKFGLGRFSERQSKFQLRCGCFHQLELLIKSQKAKENFKDNYGHNNI